MRSVLLAALLAVPALPAAADEVTGEILAYDRLANVLIMRDKTVWQLGSDVAVPSDLAAGDRVRIVYETAGEDGLTKIDSLDRVDG